MEIEFLGYFILPLGLIFFFYSPKRLYDLTVFSIPFTGSALFEISYSGFSIEGIRPSMYLGALCLLRYLISVVVRNRIIIAQKAWPAVIALFALAGVTGLSLLMPMWIDGRISVLDSYSQVVMYAEPKPLYFKLQYVTQFVYFLFGCFLAYYFAVKNNSEENIARTIRVYLYASLFVCFWGVLEIVLFYVHLPYPGFIFNGNDYSMNAQGSLVLDGRPRITSVSLEPSVMSQQLITALPLAFWPVMENKWALGNINLKLVLYSIVVILIFSLSTTAIFGLVMFALLVVLDYLKRRKVNIYLLSGIMIACFALLVVTPFLLHSFFEKLSTYSGVERLKALQFGWYYFSQYPVLGVGWGVFPSWDLVVCFLGGAGIIGLFFFLVMVIVIYINFRNLKQAQQSTIITKAAGYSFVMALLISQFSGFLYTSQFFWLILGLAIAASSLRKKTERAQNSLQ